MPQCTARGSESPATGRGAGTPPRSTAWTRPRLRQGPRSVPSAAVRAAPRASRPAVHIGARGAAPTGEGADYPWLQVRIQPPVRDGGASEAMARHERPCLERERWKVQQRRHEKSGSSRSARGPPAAPCSPSSPGCCSTCSSAKSTTCSSWGECPDLDSSHPPGPISDPALLSPRTPGSDWPPCMACGSLDNAGKTVRTRCCRVRGGRRRLTDGGQALLERCKHINRPAYTPLASDKLAPTIGLNGSATLPCPLEACSVAQPASHSGGAGRWWGAARLLGPRRAGGAAVPVAQGAHPPAPPSS